MVQHVDPEVLALLALGEDVASDSERTHLEVCTLCSDEVVELAEVAGAARTVTADDTLVPPAPEVWDRVRAELGLAAAAQDDAPQDDREPAPVVNLASRRRGPGAGWLAAAASVALVVGVAGGVLWERREDVPGAPTETTLASATLEALPDWADSTGEARVEETADGVRQVVVSVDAPPSDGGYREVWLLAEDLSGLVSIGVLEGTEGRFDIPADLDLSRFSVVDVSEEHFDGDPAHSGDSVVRGSLTDQEA
ncbi:anti-sigma factor [Sanguibacter suaedae]|uniref:Anti-sigma factor n=1 Tax=Sanguibacter suaedae TaxID=2795737 RepID=A0A934M7V2_9MICO|nr:anti-sigma factor [Sanguibacter suaedae]MBI9115827.1 anti-sigma factor [Sanguibacter suaedae]